MNPTKTISLIRYEEGYRPVPYYDSERYPTIGIGRRIPGTEKNDPLPAGMKTEEKTEVAWTQGRIGQLDKELAADTTLGKIYQSLNDDRQAVVISMAYQLGVKGLKKFSRMLAACAVADWKLAGKEARNSLAYSQTPNRWERQAKVLEGGTMFKIYPS